MREYLASKASGMHGAEEASRSSSDVSRGLPAIVWRLPLRFGMILLQQKSKIVEIMANLQYRHTRPLFENANC